MIVACEKFQDKVYIVDGNGRFWRFEINWAGEPPNRQVIACEKFQDKVYIVDGNGRFWRFEINWAGEPQVTALTKLFRHDELNAMVRPQLAHWDNQP